MESQPSLEGASHTTGGHLHGRAHGNNLNHADFSLLSGFPAQSTQVIFQIFAYIIYRDPIKIKTTPDPSVHPNMIFQVSLAPPFNSSVVLLNIANHLETVTGEV